MHDLQMIEAEHQEDVVLLSSGLARDERGIAVERDAGARDRGFVLRRRNNAIHLVREGGLDRRGGKRERGLATRRANGAELEPGQTRLRAVDHIDALCGPVDILDPRDHTQVDRDAAGGGMALQYACIADQD